jgi:hypothetical protein
LFTFDILPGVGPFLGSAMLVIGGTVFACLLIEEVPR